MATPFTMGVLERMYERVRHMEPLYDVAHVGHRTFYDLLKNEVMYEPVPARSLYGMELKVSSMFPYTHTCSECNGTGEGKTSTYCPKCKGAGAERVEGMMTGARGSMCLITSPLPKKFAPRWPADVLVPKRPIR